MTLGDTEEPERLRTEVHKWEAMLLRSDAFAYVRRLILYSADLEREMPDNPYLALEPCERYDDPAHLQSCWDLYDCWWAPAVSESEPPLPSLRDEDWQSVIHLVGQLHGLTDIFYACVAQFPSSLLETLRLELPRCRLHHFNFHLRDPNGAYERALATAPCLYSIGDLDHVDDQTGRLFARRHAPHLRNVFLGPSRRTLRDAAAGNHAPPESSGRDLVGALQHIELGKSRGFQPISPSLLDFVNVARLTFGDFSALRILRLNSTMDYRTLPLPENFPALVTLALTCIDNDTTASSYWTAALAFIRNLSRLTTLQLTAWNRSISVVPGLNPNLRKLQLSTYPVVGADPLPCDYIHQLATRCPHLEELAIEMRRSRGDASEVALYRALGRLPRLRRLTLDLDASPAPLVQVAKEDGAVSQDTPVEPWFDAWGAEYLQGAGMMYPSLRLHRKGHLLDVFVNSAINERLARSIFAVIDGAKRTITGRRGVVSLEKLEVSASNGRGFPQRGYRNSPMMALSPYLNEALGRKWLVTRSVRDDAQHVLHASQLCHRCQCVSKGTPQGWCGMMKLRRAREVDPQTRELVSKGGPYAEVWTRLWPEKGDGNAWLDSWGSWPLELGSGDQ